ncbi:MAG: hypothetical protein WA003_09990 [Desulfuromonadaceae bacterium]
MTNEMHPFADEEVSLQIGDLTVENRLDRVSLYGSLDLTLDKAGLENARQLQALLALTVAEMEKTTLPERIAVQETETVKNPFA